MARRSLSDSQVLAQVPGARARARLSLATEPHARSVSFDRVHRALHVVLTNGVVLIVPVPLLGALRAASEDDLAEVRVGPAGVGLRWERIDTDLSVSQLANAALGRSILLRAAGSAGGSARTRAKVRAAQANGKKGGRPRKGARTV
jgi:hypothetical protein